MRLVSILLRSRSRMFYNHVPETAGPHLIDWSCYDSALFFWENQASAVSVPRFFRSQNRARSIILPCYPLAQPSKRKPDHSSASTKLHNRVIVDFLHPRYNPPHPLRIGSLALLNNKPLPRTKLSIRVIGHGTSVPVPRSSRG